MKTTTMILSSLAAAMLFTSSPALARQNDRRPAPRRIVQPHRRPVMKPHHSDLLRCERELAEMRRMRFKLALLRRKEAELRALRRRLGMVGGLSSNAYARYDSNGFYTMGSGSYGQATLRYSDTAAGRNWRTR